MSVTSCPSCNTPVPPGSIFCDNCGYDLRTVAAAPVQPPAPNYQAASSNAGNMCPTCGHANVAGSAFCENCGSQLAQSAQPVQPASPGVVPSIAVNASQAQTPAYNPPIAVNASQAQTPAYNPPVSIPPSPPVHTPPPPAYTPPPAAVPATITGRLVIQSSNTVLPIPSGKQVVVLGREDPVSSIFPEIDLDPFGAQDEGVGRKHAQLVLVGGQVCIEDLESVNGTVVDRQRIAPRQPQPLKDGAEVRLGKMILIYHAS